MIKMNILFILFVSLLMICNCEENIDPKIIEVSVNFYPAEDECEKHVQVLFKDPSSDGPGNYWAGLIRINSIDGDQLIAHSDCIEKTPPLGFTSIWFYLNNDDLHNAGWSPKDIIKGFVAKNDILYNVPDLNGHIKASNWTDGTINVTGFPNLCNGFNIVLESDGERIYSGSCNTFISEQAIMPDLEARLENCQITGLVDWKIRFRYRRSGRDDWDSVMSTNRLYTDIWDINAELGNMIRGGEAELSCSSHVNSRVNYFYVGIGGLNPPEQTIIDYIESRPNVPWYHRWVAKHEGGMQKYVDSEGDSIPGHYLQFNEVGSRNCLPYDVRYTPNATSDEGFGIYMLTDFQLTGDDTSRPPNSQELWSWTENVISGTSYLAIKQSGANNYMLEETEQAFEIDPECVYPPDETVGDITFSNITAGCQPMEHAVALKRYNGLGIIPEDHGYTGYDAGNRQYCEWRDTENDWRFNRLAYRINSSGLVSQNYVERVCDVVEQ